jgi:hypothetical protein
MRSVAAERPYYRQPQLHADRDAGRDGGLSAAFVTAQLLTVQFLKASRSAFVLWGYAGRE